MGLFDFFSKKKKEESDAEEFMKALIQYQVESSKDGVDTDEIPKGYGPFGLCVTNPVPTQGILGSQKYLERLRTKAGQPIESNRRGSTQEKSVTSGNIDIYSITCNEADLGTIYICPYHKRNSQKAPEGFRIL
jgi:hypothetical protein